MLSVVRAAAQNLMDAVPGLEAAGFGPSVDDIVERTTWSLPGLSELCELLDAIPRDYRVYELRNRSGKLRRIEAPNPTLKTVQRTLLRELLYRLQPHEAAHGFVPGRSVISHATPHAGRAWVVSLDIRAFFPSTREPAIRDVLHRLPDRSNEEIESILRIVTRRGSLPQGAPTSPHLANLAFHAIDVELEKLATTLDLRYTRYADDLTFSSDRVVRGLIQAVGEIVEKSGYRVARQKTKIMGAHVRQLVTGLVVNERVRLPRELRRWLRAVQHDAVTHGLEVAVQRSGGESEARLRGYLALLGMVEPEMLARELEALRRALDDEGGADAMELAGRGRTPEVLRPESARRTARAASRADGGSKDSSFE